MKKREFNAPFSQNPWEQSEPEACSATEIQDAGNATQMPPELIQKIATLEHKARQKRRYGKMRQVAASVLVVFGVISVTVQPVRASWRSLFQLFGESYEKYIVLQFDEAQEQASADRINRRIYERYHGIFVPKWVPASYTVDIIRQGEDYNKITYYDRESSGEIIFIRATAATHVDDEMENPETFYTDGQEYIWGEKTDEGLRWLVWQTQTDVFTLRGQLERDVMLKIAQNVVFQK